MKISQNIQKNLFNYLYLFFFITLPLIYFTSIIDPVLIPRQLYLSVFLLLVLILILFNLQIFKSSNLLIFKSPLILIALLLFLFFQILSITGAINKTEGLYVISKTGVFIAFYFITTILLIQKRLDISFIIKGIIILNILVNIVACYQLISLFLNGNDFWQNILSIKSTIANKNLLSSLLLITIPFLFGAILLNKTWKIISLITFIVNLIIILLLQTRATWLAGMFYAMLLLLILRLQDYKILRLKKEENNSKLNNLSGSNYRFLIIYVVLLFLLSLTEICIIAYNYQYSDLKKSGTLYTDSYTAKYPAFTLADNTHTFKARRNLWGNSYEMIKEFPLRGVGAGNWQIFFPKYGLDKFSRIVYSGIMTSQRPHNDYLWVFAETGLFGFISYLLIFIFLLFYLFRLISNTEDYKYKMFYVFMFTGVIAYMLISFFDFPFERIEHQVLLFAIFAIVTAEYNNSKFYILYSKLIQNSKFKIQNFLCLVSCVLCLFSLIVSAYRLDGEKHTFKMMRAHHERDWNTMLAESKLAINTFHNLDPMTTPLYWYEGVAYFSMNKVDSATISFEKSYALHPYNVHVLNNLGSCYETKDRHEEAILMYKKALAISPRFAESLLNLAATYYNSGQYENAFQTIRQCKIYTTDKKYSVFLPPILHEKLKLIIKSDERRAKSDEQLSIMKRLLYDNKQLVNIFKESKIKNINFEDYLLQITKD